MAAFSAFGALIHSALPLAFSTQAGSAPPRIDIKIHSSSALPVGHGLERTGQALRIWWESIGEFKLRPDGHIAVFPVAGADPKHLTIALSGIVMALQMHLLGRFVLHGNALTIGQRGIIIVGNKGEGKSTISAALMSRGHGLLSDDVAAMAVGSDSAVVYRGNLQLKLWPDSLENCLRLKPDDYPSVAEGCEKRLVSGVPFASPHAALPLCRVYVLHEGPETRIEPLSPAEGWKACMAHSYASRYGSTLLQGVHASSHFELCSRLVSHTTCARVWRPLSFESMSEVVHAIEQDAYGAAVATAA